MHENISVNGIQNANSVLETTESKEMSESAKIDPTSNGIEVKMSAIEILPKVPAASVGPTPSLTTQLDDKKSAATQIVDAFLGGDTDTKELWRSPEGVCHFSLRYADGRVIHRSFNAKTTKQNLGFLLRG